MYNKERIDRLYNASLERALSKPGNTFIKDYHTLALGEYKGLPTWERIARSMAGAIMSMPVYIYEDDRIVGRVYHENSDKGTEFDPELLEYTRADCEKYFEGYGELMQYQLAGFNVPGHIAWDWNTVLRYGTEGIKERARLGMKRNTDEKSLEFYKGVIIMVEALEAWNDLHVKELRLRGMNELADICEKVPRYPAESFREAVQSFFMQHIVVMRENPYGGNSPGRLDYYLWPYLEADINKGVCTLDDARELICELFFRIDERIHGLDGWVEALAIGGSHPNGTSAINPLTYIMIEESMKYDLTHPSVYVRLPKHTPKDFTELCAKYIKSGNNRAQILCDETITKALVRNGVPYSDAVDYYCGGCMEIGVQGKTADYLWVGYQSIGKFLELQMTGGYCLTTKKQLAHFRAKPLWEYTDFEDFYRDFIEEYRRISYIFFGWQDYMGKRTAKVRPSYLISAMIDSCLFTGRNMHDGGAKYYDYGVSVIGFANAADSLTAVKKAVFEYKICTARELVDAMKANFVGYEELRARLSALPKYGRENAEADAMMNRLVKDVGDVYQSYRNRLGGTCKLVILTFVWSVPVGNLLGASADGRLAGQTIAQGVTPTGRAMTEGITAAMNSCAAIPFEVMAGGASSMWDLDESFASEPVIEALLMSFFEKGGQIFQGNATDVRELIKAKENPDGYYSLIVRVGGYSARFVNLTPELQDEIIARVRHTR